MIFLYCFPENVLMIFDYEGKLVGNCFFFSFSPVIIPFKGCQTGNEYTGKCLLAVMWFVFPFQRIYGSSCLLWCETDVFIDATLQTLSSDGYYHCFHLLFLWYPCLFRFVLFILILWQQYDINNGRKSRIKRLIWVNINGCCI